MISHHPRFRNVFFCEEKRFVEFPRQHFETQSQWFPTWASAENFPRGATSTFFKAFSDCCRCNANGRSQNALPFLHHKEKAQCYRRSHKNAFIGSNRQAWESEGFFPEGANQGRISRPPYPQLGGALLQGSKIQSRCHGGAFVGLALQTKLQPPN